MNPIDWPKIMRNFLVALPFLLFLVATIMLIFTFAGYGDGNMRGQIGLTFIATAITYVASAIAYRQQGK